MSARAVLCGLPLGVCLCLACAGQAGAQVVGGMIGVGGGGIPGQMGAQPNQPGPVRTLSGTVVDSVTGEPIPRTLVRVFSNQPLVAMTGPDGHFEIQNVPANQTVSIGAQRPGYSAGGSGWGFYGPAASRARAGGMIRVGPNENNITIKLIPQGSIHGRIVDEDGRPVPGIQVQAISEIIMAGRKREQSLAGETTDDNGEYEIGGLTPGAYFVRTMMHPLYWTTVALPAAQLAYPSEFYPDAPDRASVQPVQVQPGQAAEADFALKPVRTYRISGVIAGMTTPWAMIMLKSPDGERVWNPGVQFNRQRGTFTLSSVPAGSWTLEFRANPQNGSGVYVGSVGSNSDLFYAEQQIEVNSDISNLQVVLQPLSPITVNIVHPPDTQTAANTGAPYRAQPQVELIRTDSSAGDPFFGNGISYAMPARQQSATPDTLLFQGVAPGRYHVAVHTFGSECLDSITSGSLDLMHDDLTVTAGAASQPITVTLRNDCATLAGTVHAQGRTAPAQVLVMPNSSAIEPQIMIAPPDSQFTVRGLAPGTYRVYAFSSLDDLEYTNPDALRDFAPKEITLNANENANVSLDLIVRGEQ